MESLRDSWVTYEDKNYGFTFEYPAVYDYEPYKVNCGVRKPNGDIIKVGALNDLFIIPTTSSDLAAYVKELIETKQAGGWVIETTQTSEFNQQQAITMEYRTDANGGRYGKAVFFYDKTRALIYAFGVVGFDTYCGVPGSKLNEYSLQEHLVNTFRMTP
jgi:hypothetical protein